MKKWLMMLFGCCAPGGCNNAPAKIVMPDGAVLLDVRSAEEFAQGHIPWAVNIPHDLISEKIAGAVPVKNTPLYIYCRSGRRVKIAMETLRKLGYEQLHNLGGIEEAGKVLDIPLK